MHAQAHSLESTSRLTPGAGDEHGRTSDIGRLIERIDDAVVLADIHSGAIVRWSRGAEALFGYRAAEMRGQPIGTLLPGLTLTSHWAALAQAADGGEPESALELVGCGKNGEQIEVAVTLSRMQIDPQAPHALVFVRQTTERKRAAGTLEARNRALTTLNRISEIALESDSLGAAYQEIVAEISLTTGFPIVLIEHFDQARQVMTFAGGTGMPAPAHDSVIEAPVQHTLSGQVVRTRRALVSTRPLQADDHPHDLLRRLSAQTFVCVPMIVGSQVVGALSLAHPDAVADVDDLLPWLRGIGSFVASLIARARVEAERLELMREQSARAQAEAAVQARDEFLSIAAHELTTPVSALRAYAQHQARRLERSQADAEEVRDGFAVIAEQTGKLARLVVQLLDVSRIEAGKLAIDPQPCDVAACVRSVVTLTQTLTDQHTLIVRAPRRVIAIVDGMRVEQVLTNLVNNAIRYSPGGGRIEVDVDQPSAVSVRVAVRDYGIGIPPEHCEHIFDRFYQAHSGGLGGMGLGLYISKQIVQQHGGEIDVECPPDGGTRFVLTLPRGLELA